uniref:centrosomal protein of 131 kDa-like n=1 Tax=Panthera onca TaxID=9690 RepID=UPI0029530BFE
RLCCQQTPRVLLRGSPWVELSRVPRRPPTVGVVAAVGPQGRLDGAAVRRLGLCCLPEPDATPVSSGRSNKGAVGNRVTTMLHNRYTPSEKAPPPKSSNHTAPSLNNILKAATGEGESGGSGKPHKNFSSSNHVAQNNAGATPGLLRRKEVTEEEAERFIHQVNRAAVTIQRWYRQQVQRRQARAARREHLLAPKREEQRQQLGDRNVPDLQQQKEAARRKVREEKARQARRLAVQELQQQKRAQKSGDPEPGLQKEARETEKPQPAQESALRPGSTARAHRTHKANNTSAGAGFRSAGAEDPCHPASNSSPEPRQFPENKPQDAGSQDVASKDVEVVGPAKGKAQSRATLDELLATLRLLEEEPEPLPNPRAYHKDKYSWTDEEDDASSLTADNLERFGRLGTCASPPEDGTLLSEAKLQSIMSFLHEMEKSGQDRPASAPQGLVLDEGRLEPTSTVSSSVMRLKLEVEEKKQAVGLLQKALVQQRDLTVRRVKETEKELGRQLRQQRDHYEATIQRHLSFIDQLIEDKKALAERCEAVVAELKQGDQRRRDREAQVQEQHELEIKKLKELMSATEKVRREKWINEKTRKIKEITVRGGDRPHLAGQMLTGHVAQGEAWGPLSRNSSFGYARSRDDLPGQLRGLRCCRPASFRPGGGREGAGHTGQGPGTKGGSKRKGVAFPLPPELFYLPGVPARWEHGGHTGFPATWLESRSEGLTGLHPPRLACARPSCSRTLSSPVTVASKGRPLGPELHGGCRAARRETDGRGPRWTQPRLHW